MATLLLMATVDVLTIVAVSLGLLLGFLVNAKLDALRLRGDEALPATQGPNR